jgi:hypothetical protein
MANTDISVYCVDSCLRSAQVAHLKNGLQRATLVPDLAGSLESRNKLTLPHHYDQPAGKESGGWGGS